MPEVGTNRGYLETDIDEIQDQPTVESNSVPYAGSRSNSRQNGDIAINNTPEDNVPEETLKTPFLDKEPYQGGTYRTDDSLFSSNKDESQTNQTEEHVSSKSPFLQVNPLEASYAVDESEGSEVVSNTPSFPQYRHIAAVILFLPLGWFAYKKAKEAYGEQSKTNYKKKQRRREFAEGLTTLSICLGVAMLCLLLFLLVARLLSFFWQPGNLAKLCHDIQVLGYTSRACPNIEIG
ncbi:uncharacterized protein LOC110459895 [Mizuhopecten yessoensis]|uniref:Uncharacterized protein n=1 Tax=Mizuhopecten yessoensis TaxID=6573 RepID=A0A210Q394_MIZYE|nr:uncharacterized protein LOC110459895 [Mizuhopecten yessoensis]XP_021368050.1 uncharacterized protein LOC110459895 [Mizuhopecten yessoensis]OWF43228.1 hypothetical protein KP79_PYT18820 [Mizuhopecten yessoensis]